ncbi:MAG: hypothetical protein B7X58_05020 [Marinobacter sp. 34-60-7]|nr:MAG: hypothetical protein B7X58_05020 [Marinobacter sp. 34-60-7]
MQKIFFTLVFSAVATVTLASEPSNGGLCRGAISLVMLKDHSIIEAQDHGSEVHVSYTRPADGSKFELKCKFPKESTVIWAGKIDGKWGRWRDKSDDSVVTYKVSGGSITFYENMAGRVINQKTIDITEL